MGADTSEDLDACIDATARLDTMPGAEYRSFPPAPDAFDVHNHLSRVAILLPIRQAHALKAAGTIDDETATGKFSTDAG